MNFPEMQEIMYQDPIPIAASFANEDGTVFLDSAKYSECGRYSFIAVDPFLKLISKNGRIYDGVDLIQGDPFETLERKLKLFSLSTYADLPPFQGGAAGFLSYELVHHLEKISNEVKDDMKFPDMAIGFYDVVIAFDHESKRSWVFSSGFPETENNLRIHRAQKRLAWILSKLPSSKNFVIDPKKKKTITEIKSNFSRDEYCQAVQKVKEYILSGDIFQTNISQRFCAELPCEPWSLFINLRSHNPASFSAFINMAETIIASASPERFLKLTNGEVETRPIKGTRPRGKTPEEDKKMANELMNSAKDLAENAMIVDLLRNDLSRVCEDHTVQVPQLCGLESYATVHHLVSIVIGQLQKNYGAVELLRATFPGGSITGAPKIRAMEIIAEMESTQRGPYCGSIGYIGFDGNMDTSITIRTYAIKNNIVTFQAGGGIVLDSEPEAEYEETLSKAQALHRALYDFID